MRDESSDTREMGGKGTVAPHAVDRLLGIPLSALTSCEIPPLATEFEDRTTWFDVFTLNSLALGQFVEAGFTLLTLLVVRNLVAAIDDYDDARLELSEFLTSRKLRHCLALICTSSYRRSLGDAPGATSLAWRTLDVTRLAPRRSIRFVHLVAD